MTRVALDRQDLTAAQALDDTALAALLDDVPEVVHEIKSGLHPGTKTPYPLRQALGKYAREAHELAWACYKQADEAYWRIVYRHAAFIQQRAAYHARRSGVDVDVVRSVLYEGAHRAAVCWNPEKGTYLTAAARWMDTHWQFSPDRQSAVPVGRGVISRAPSGFGRVVTVAFDSEHEGTYEEDEVAERIDATRVTEVTGLLTSRERFVLEQYYVHDLTTPEIGRMLGLSRESARLILKSARQKLRDALEAP